jgi:acetyltransferase-like isoleucine patch superfamily enzyme
MKIHQTAIVSPKAVIGASSTIGPYSIIHDNVVIFTNDPTPPSNSLIGCTVKKFSIVSAGSTILPGIVVGQGALVAANSCVTKNIPDGKLVVGNPAKVVKDVSEVILRDGSNLPAYPWTNHF